MGGPGSGIILVAVDGSQNSMVAAAVGARLGKMLNARLGLVHVLEVPPLSFWVAVEKRMKEDIRAEAERVLRDVSERIAASCDLAPSFYVVEGPPEEEICRLAEEDPEVLMVVAGRHGVTSERRSRLTQPFSGEVSRKLASRLPAPLLLIPPDIRMSHICSDLAGLIVRDPGPR
jgi:nucleotide-binding universal stress UspA family protein